MRLAPHDCGGERGVRPQSAKSRRPESKKARHGGIGGRSDGFLCRSSSQAALRWSAAKSRAGRALVIKPNVLLLDEPLSNLDAKLRLEMRQEIRRLCKTSGITTVYVTHDQEEALSMADRMAVLKMARCGNWGPSDVVSAAKHAICG